MTHPEDTSLPAEEPGGSGGHSARDTRLAARAIRERWPMSRRVRIKVLNRLVGIVDEDRWEETRRDERPGFREVISAARTIISADRLNLDQQRVDLVRDAVDARAGTPGFAELDENARDVETRPAPPAQEGMPG